MKKYYLPMTISVVVAFLFTMVFAYGSTTIDTSINTGGSLTVSGAATIGGAATLNGALTANSTATFTSGATMSDTLVLYNAASAGTATEGGIYYDSTNSVIKMYDGTNWFTVGTSTIGTSLYAPRLQMDSLSYYMTYGTTTQSGLSVMTLEATSTAAIPLTIRAYTNQTANLLQIHNVAGTELFAVDYQGSASTTVLSASGNVYVGGALAVTGAVGITGLTSMSGASTTGAVTIGTLASTTQLNVGGAMTNSTISGILFGTCTIDPDDGYILAAVGATTTACTATGVTTDYKVFVTPNLPTGLALSSASSTANNTIRVMIITATSTSPAIGAYGTWSWMAIK